MAVLNLLLVWGLQDIEGDISAENDLQLEDWKRRPRIILEGREEVEARRMVEHMINGDNLTHISKAIPIQAGSTLMNYSY